jgi:oligopeptidase B
MSVPTRCGSWWYFARTIEGLPYPISCRIPAENTQSWEVPAYNDADAEVIFDANVEAQKCKQKTGGEFFSIGTTDISEDGKLLLFSVDTAGNERYDLFVRDIKTGQNLPDRIENIAHSALFDITGEYIFYTRADDAWRTHQVLRHKIGERDDKNDVVVFQEDDELFNAGIGIAPDRQTIYIESASKETTEFHTISATTPENFPAVFWQRVHGVEYELEIAHINGVEYNFVAHNKDSVDFDVDLYVDGKYLGRFLSSTSANYAPCKIQDVSVYLNYIVVTLKKDTLNHAYYLSIDNFLKNPLKPEENWVEIVPDNLELYNLNIVGSEFESPLIRYIYSSYITASKLISLTPSTGEKTLLKRQEIEPNVDGEPFSEENYAQKRLYARTPEGKNIPISLIWRKNASDDERLPENRPVLQTGYGAYGISLSPHFSISRLSLLDRGVVYAVAHIRGGGDLGRGWYLDGNKLHKKNTFTDFICCLKFLKASKILDPERVVISGGSAGGLLVGAVMNMLIQEQVNGADDALIPTGVVADVPFVDILTTMLDTSLPLTIPEQEEWGDPIADRAVYDYIKSYAPYHNIVDLRNASIKPPQILAQTSLNDTRVLYVEPAKWVAKLRALGYNPLLKCEMESGHAGVSGRYNIWKETAFELAWILQVLGVGNS